MSQSATDQELVRRVQRGDKKAFDLIVLKYQHKITHLVGRYVNHTGDALDVTQEVFIKAYRALETFRGESAFYTWLYRIAVNTAKNHLVAQGRRPPASDIDSQEAEQYEGAVLLRESNSPDRLLLRDELKKVVFDTIDNLPEELKAAITLREFEGLSYEEIAEVMECPVGTVRSRIFRAREAIDANVKPYLQSD
ncbi:MAG: RNA polymerase sigma factor RpoE [Pseudomonadota bacterium]